MPIRGELSVMACIMCLGHAYTFCMVYLSHLIHEPNLMPNFQIVALFSAILFLLIMIPLFVTSFNTVKRRMHAANWKHLQLAAYPFFALLYVHVVIFLLPAAIGGSSQALNSLIVYTVVFVGYAVLRVRKALVDKREHTRSAGSTGSSGSANSAQPAEIGLGS
jgi:DMSO/TMAO reductase YedYZ heme-binding membrane subunit